MYSEGIYGILERPSQYLNQNHERNIKEMKKKKKQEAKNAIKTQEV